MLRKFQKFEELLNKNAIAIMDKRLNKIFQSYCFHYVSQHFDIDQYPAFNLNIESSKLIIIDYYDKDPHFIISFHNSIIIVNSQSLNLINSIFTKNKKIYFLHDCKQIFDQSIQKDYKEFSKDDCNFLATEISSFNTEFKLSYKFIKQYPEASEFFSNIQSCITGYLITSAYCKLKKDRITDFFKYKKKPKERIFCEDEYIELRLIEIGSVFNIRLIYLIESNELLAIKIPHILSDEITKLIERERRNYSLINYQFIPNFYGTVKDKNYIVFEYIKGETLNNIKKQNFSIEQKLTIIFQLLSIIDYLHECKFIYRDLHTNNIIIDENKTAVLIDFDRMILNNEKRSINSITNNFSNIYNAPEINSINCTNKCDIYSLGKIIYYIMNEENPKDSVLNDNLNSEIHSKIIDLCKKCINEKPEERPTLSKLIKYFYTIIIDNTDFVLKNIDPLNQTKLGKLFEENNKIDKAIQYYLLAADQNDSNALLCLGNIYHKGKLGSININKAIHYLTLASNLDNPRAQDILGLLYAKGKYVPIDAEKAIHYLTLASNNEYSDANVNLGYIYIMGKIVKKDWKKGFNYYLLAAKQNNSRAQLSLGLYYSKSKNWENIRKGIHYLWLAAHQNNSEAQIKLGNIYYENIIVPRDIKKAIHYYRLAADQNNLNAQLNLGYIYYENNIVPCDIQKAIHYFTLASTNYNSSKAQYILGEIFYNGFFVPINMNKSIYYFSLAAKQNHSGAQFELGVIYYTGKLVTRDIEKTIYYFTLASKQNHSGAQFELGVIYYTGKLVTRDIEKAIYYFTLASKQNHSDAQFELGVIYYTGKLVTRDIEKAIYYFSLASKQNHSDAQFELGVIYSNIEYSVYDIKKAIYYYSLAADQNNSNAQFKLGTIYYTGDLVTFDIEKAIYYFTLAASQKNISALHILGLIYFKGLLVPCNIQKAIRYLTTAANLNCSFSQYELGCIYIQGRKVQENIYKGIDLIMQSSKNGCLKAHFSLAFYYHEGKYLKRDIKKAVRLYKEGSSFKDQYSKNNLGVLYKDGFGEEFPKNLKAAKIYFKEAIKQKNDKLAKYNLAHLYIFEQQTEKYIKKAIKLLSESSSEGFDASNILICFILVTKFGISFDDIDKEILKYTKNTRFIGFDKNFLYYTNIRNFDFLYDGLYNPTPSEFILNHSNQIQIYDFDDKSQITSEFYEGFGYDILNN